MRKISLAFLFVLLCASWFMTFPCEAATVWSDDFDDGDYEEWTVTNGTFIVEDGVLKNGPGDYNVRVHSSSVAFGTWSFDILVSSAARTGVIFIGTHPVSYTTDYPGFPLPRQGLGIQPWSSGFRLSRIRDNSVVASIPTSGFAAPAGTSGWHHIDITRSSDGRICVYNNGTFVYDTVDESVTSTSELFEVYIEGAIDNIVVSDTVDIVAPPSTPFYMETWFLATTGAGVLVAAIVIIAVMMRRK